MIDSVPANDGAPRVWSRRSLFVVLASQSLTAPSPRLTTE
jgi:hypothetical protein